MLSCSKPVIMKPAIMKSVIIPVCVPAQTRPCPSSCLGPYVWSLRSLAIRQASCRSTAPRSITLRALRGLCIYDPRFFSPTFTYSRLPRKVLYKQQRKNELKNTKTPCQRTATAQANDSTDQSAVSCGAAAAATANTGSETICVTPRNEPIELVQRKIVPDCDDHFLGLCEVARGK